MKKPKPIQENSVVLYEKDKGTVIHIYKDSPLCVVEFKNYTINVPIKSLKVV